MTRQLSTLVSAGLPLVDCLSALIDQVDSERSKSMLTQTRERVNEGTSLTFTASATDPDIPAQSLIFSLDPGAPAGASINPGSGVFKWTPTEAQRQKLGMPRL